MWQGLVGWLDGGGRELGLRVTNSFPTYFGSLEVKDILYLKVFSKV